MLSVTHLSGFGAERDSHKLYDIINRAGLLSSCLVCIDAADALSYTSGQTITDRIGGNNYFLGATNAVEATDPTFVGVAGDASAYFSFDGGDYFARTAAQTFDATWHQANGKFTVLSLFYPIPAKTGNTALWANRTNAAANAGISFECTDDLRCRLAKTITTTTVQALSSPLSNPATANMWNVFIAGCDDASQLVRLQVNDFHHSQTCTASTDTDPVSGSQTLCALSGGTRQPEAGERWAGFAAFNRMLDESQMSNLAGTIAATRPGYA